MYCFEYVVINHTYLYGTNINAKNGAWLNPKPLIQEIGGHVIQFFHSIIFLFHTAVSSYIIWGRKTCPQVNGTKLLYSGKSLDYV